MNIEYYTNRNFNNILFHFIFENVINLELELDDLYMYGRAG